MKVVFCGLTGLGNVALKKLIELKIDILEVYTRKEKGLFPYFNCEDISDLANKNNIPVSFDEIEKGIKADLCLVSTYHRKIELNKYSFKKAINIHPSYLPYFRGRDPIYEAIKNKSTFTGVTAFHMTENLDDGKIIIQERFKIEKNDDKAKLLKKMLPIYDKFTNFIIENLNNLK
jgi:phosphoribosylglycinamide formyltransferase-1